ncbi:MAG: GNAT family N-acetyltransferase, partial [Candidatus Izemoplasmatales bacterium]
MKLITTQKIISNTSLILDHWNNEFSNTFLLSEELFNIKIINSDYTLINESFCLFDNEEYIGTIVFKVLDENLYISIIHVIKDKQFLGYGKLLIKEAYELAKKNNYKKIFLGSDPECLFSGVFMEGNDEVHRFFSNQGFAREYLNYNLIAYTSPETIWLSNDYEIKKADLKRRNELLNFINDNFSKRWLLEVSNNSINQVYILLHKNKIIGFINSALSNNHHYPNSLNLYKLFDNLAGIGPLGIAPIYQSKGLGKGFVNYVLRDLF